MVDVRKLAGEIKTFARKRGVVKAAWEFGTSEETVRDVLRGRTGKLESGANARNFPEWYRATRCEAGWEPSEIDEPSTELPGSHEKIELMAKRYAGGKELFVDGEPTYIMTDEAIAKLIRGELDACSR